MTAKKYVKKPIIISAMQWTGDNTQDILDWVPNSFHPAYPIIVIPTMEGAMQASLHDFIIRGVRGEFYPCKPDIFYDTYQALTEHEHIIGQEDGWHH